ncbi:MAG: peptidase [Bacillus sp. (in: firmicutes)]
MEVEKKVRDYIKAHRDESALLLKRMIQQPSERGNEGRAQAIVVEKCRQLGLEIDLWEVDEDPAIKSHPGFHSDREDFQGNPNLAATLKGKGGGKSLILNGHIDVVPPGNRQDWSDSPYSGKEEEGRIYGRGATDMKGGNAALLMALEAIVRSGIQLRGDVIFQSVIEEESGGAGTLSAVLRGYRADGAVIPEPTSMKLFTLQQGSVWFRLTIRGKSAHGGTRYEGVSSIELATAMMNELMAFETDRNKELKLDPLYASADIPIPINIGKIHSGDWPSSVPDLAILEGRLGISPYESADTAMVALEELLIKINGEHSWFKQKPVELEWFGARWLPGRLEPDHPLVKSMQEQYGKVKQADAIIEASPWGTDGGILSAYGDIPVVVFGPGVTEKAHDSDEYIVMQNVVETAEIIALTILDWCGVAKGGETG